VSRAHALLADNILTYQNHPSVLVWSIGNELPIPATGAESAYIAGATALAHRLDPTRPVAMSDSAWPGVACQPAYAPLDVVGFNDYFWWFDAGDGGTADRQQLSPFLDSFRACYPSKALSVSEFGFDANRDGPVEERGTYAFQADSAAYHLRVFACKSWLAGAIYFLLQDSATFLGYSGGNPLPTPPLDQKGLIDAYGTLKPAFSSVAAIFKATPQIAPPGASHAVLGGAVGSRFDVHAPARAPAAISAAARTIATGASPTPAASVAARREGVIEIARASGCRIASYRLGRPGSIDTSPWSHPNATWPARQ